MFYPFNITFLKSNRAGEKRIRKKKKKNIMDEDIGLSSKYGRLFK